MENIGVVGASFRNESSELLAQLTVPKSERTDRLPELARQVGVSELVYIATCNRVEVAFQGDGKVAMQEYRRRVFRALVDREPRAGEAERHTSRVGWRRSCRASLPGRGGSRFGATR